jgi:hypothetical protein
MTVLTERFSRAVDYARIARADPVRKGTDIPYLTHLQSVSLVIEFGRSCVLQIAPAEEYGRVIR